MKKRILAKKALWIFISILLIVFLISLAFNVPTNKEFHRVNYDSIVNSLDKTDEPYYLLVCESQEKQCDYMLQSVQNADQKKYDLYYLDANYFTERINTAQNKEDLNYYISEFRTLLGNIGIFKLPTLQLRDNGVVKKQYNGFYNDKYEEALNNGEKLNGILDDLSKDIVKFVEND